MGAFSSQLLSVVAVVLMHIFFVAAVLQRLTEPRWILFYFNTVSVYGALYFRRWLYLRRRCGGIYRGLGYTAVMLGAFLSALFFFSVDTGTALPLAIGVWFGLAIAFYCFYVIITLHLHEEVVDVDMQPPI